MTIEGGQQTDGFQQEGQLQNPEEEIDQSLVESVVNVIFEQSLHIEKGDHLVLIMDASGMRLADAVKSRAEKMGVEVRLRFYASELGKLLIEDPTMEMPGYPEEQAETILRSPLMQLPPEAEKYRGTPDELTAAIHYGIGTDALEDAIWGTKFLTIRKKIASGRKYNVSNAASKELESVLSTNLRFRNSQKKEGKRYTLIYEPDEVEAGYAGISLPQYKKNLYEAISNDWEKVKEVQQRLIDYLDGKKTFEIHSAAAEGFPEDWVTDLTMSIDGMTFWNSTIDTNLPGSEVFSAPKAGTLDGTLSIPHVLMFDTRPLPNFKIRFEKGEIVEWDVYYEDPENPKRAEDLKYIEEFLKVDGARFCGELGIGTNPQLREPSANTLSDEKMGGSVHFAAGHAYEDTKNSDGVLVHTDNGIRSAKHTDLTKMLTAKYGGGTMIVDGEVIQRDGIWLLPELDYLNGNKEAA